MATPPPITALEQGDFLDMFERLLPDHYLEPLKNPGPGYEALQAFAKVGERLSQAVEHASAGLFMMSAEGGRFATGIVEFYRPAANGEGITVVVKAGTMLLASKTGVRFKTLTDVTFVAADLGPFVVEVQSEAQGYEYNVAGSVLAADGTVMQGEIDTIDVLVEDPALGDTTIVVRQHADATSDGRDATLDQHGADRRIFRAPGEGDDLYRGRVRSLPDNISPNAFERTLRQLMDPFGISFDMIETWELRYQTYYDAPDDAIVGSVFDPDLFFYDDPRPNIPFRNRWVSDKDFPGGVIVVLTPNGPLEDRALYYDDPDNSPADRLGPYGTRAPSFYDVPDSYALEPQGFYDGFDVLQASVYKRLFETLNSIKAAGVDVAVELAGQ